jgi:hypothetical protein
MTVLSFKEALRQNRCCVCGDDLGEIHLQACCDGAECACMGLPIEPPCCSYWCTWVLMNEAEAESSNRNFEVNQF